MSSSGEARQDGDPQIAFDEGLGQRRGGLRLDLGMEVVAAEEAEGDVSEAEFPVGDVRLGAERPSRSLPA